MTRLHAVPPPEGQHSDLSPGRPTDDELIAAIDAGATTTREIADGLGVPVLSIRERMKRLRDKGVICSDKATDGTTNLWSMPSQSTKARKRTMAGPNALVSRRTATKRQLALVLVAHYWRIRHAGPNLRRLCREAIKNARAE